MARTRRLHGHLKPETSNSSRLIGESWVPLEAHPHLDDMLEDRVEFEGECIGWCLLCGDPILTEQDVIPGSNYAHNCPAGQRLEREIRRALSGKFLRS